MLRSASAKRLMHDTVKMTALAALLGLAMGLAPLGLGQAQGADVAHLAITGKTFGQGREVKLAINKSLIVDLPVDAREVIVSSPAVATAIMRSKRRAILQGVGPGDTNVLFLDAAGRTIAVLDVLVDQEPSPLAAALESTLARVLPGSNVRVETLSDKAVDGTTHFLLTGTVQTAEDKAIAEAMANQLSEGDDEAGSLIQVVGPEQVMLKVTVAEVQRSTLKQLGINLSGSFSVGAVSGTFNNGVLASMPSVPAGGGGVNMPIPFGNTSLDVQLRALETRGALRTLAEPVLTAMSGQPASFLAGGEIPYNRVVDGNVVTDFKPYGVQLDFTPVIKSDGSIQLVVKSSVSEPGDQGAINRRDASTTVVLRAGETLSIAGMLSERSRHDIRRLPGLGDIPILGALFRSREYTSARTELIFLVTPYYTKAKKEMPVLPTEELQFADDAEAIFLGHIETIYGVGPGGLRGTYNGSVGFLLD